MQSDSNPPDCQSDRSNVLPFRRRQRPTAEPGPREPRAPVSRPASDPRRRAAYERVCRMKAKRAGGFAPPVNPDSEGDYMKVEMEYDGLSEYGYPAGMVLLVRTDVDVPLGRLALCERADGRGEVVGELVRDDAGNLRITSLTCGMYGYGIGRVLGLVLGPLAGEEEAERM